MLFKCIVSLLSRQVLTYPALFGAYFTIQFGVLVRSLGAYVELAPTQRIDENRLMYFNSLTTFVATVATHENLRLTTFVATVATHDFSRQ